jgi:hypothetical protein
MSHDAHVHAVRTETPFSCLAALELIGPLPASSYWSEAVIKAGAQGARRTKEKQ